VVRDFGARALFFFSHNPCLFAIACRQRSSFYDIRCHRERERERERERREEKRRDLHLNDGAVLLASISENACGSEVDGEVFALHTRA
jgi:hypothetical protein